MSAAHTPVPSSNAGEPREQVTEQLLQVLRKSISARGRDAADLFIARMMALPEAGMRSRIFAEKLRVYDAHLSFVLLRTVLSRASRRDPHCQQLLLDLCTARPLATILGYETTRGVYELARRHGEERITRLFLFTDNESARQPGRAFLKRENNRLPDESLGWRKKCARSTDRLKLDRLLFDRNPSVIRLLLRNPRIIERDVVKIAAMRPANPMCLNEIFASERWLRRYQVKVALACNPYTPVDIALACVPQLMVPRLKYLEGNSKIHPAIRDCARDILQQRGIRIGPRRKTAEQALEEELEGTDEFIVDLEKIARELEDWRADNPSQEGNEQDGEPGG